MKARKPKHAGGRPSGPKMPCGWRCGAELTASQMREHFTTCPNRPQKQSDSDQQLTSETGKTAV